MLTGYALEPVGQVIISHCYITLDPELIILIGDFNEKINPDSTGRGSLYYIYNTYFKDKYMGCTYDFILEMWEL